MSVTHGQVTFPATKHHCPLAGTKLYSLVTEAHVCVKNLLRVALDRGRAAGIWTSDQLMASPVSTATPPRHPVTYIAAHFLDPGVHCKYED